MSEGDRDRAPVKVPESLRQALQAALEGENEVDLAESRAAPPEPALGRDVTSIFDGLPGVSLPGLTRRNP